MSPGCETGRYNGSLIASAIADRRHFARSCLAEIEVVFGAPCRQRSALPDLRSERQRLMPRPWLEPTQFGNEDVHVGVELNQHLVGIKVIGREIVTRGMPRRTPNEGDLI